ncbi:glycoside hydrolase family 43 protein [Thermophagus xiamenensis]|uniref:Glycosyl hydrolases family 43 n=1 Tax=Thermophagus xiamenensis TaxID=385682 RepID=A0A1I2AVS6_9BACT|nr:glycoside hydrolase family 43 protein [Thermophagus xiamenensis]SFE47718.1 Glycosyl hydrolases family 43 [Thermophagus xiamenensis]
MIQQKAPIVLIIISSWMAVFLLQSCGRKQTNEKPSFYNAFHPGKKWFDTDSVHINAHGGGILWYNGIYYWFGEHKTAGKGGNTALVGIRCYSSKDLYNWKNEGIALAVDDDPESDIAKGCVMERPKVIYNKKTAKFVMWFHLELKGQGYSSARTGVAVSDNITGPYRYLRSYRPNAGILPMNVPEELLKMRFREDLKWWTPEWREAVHKGLFVQRDFEQGQMSRDMTLFVDDDGTAYHIHASEENLTLHISKLSEDYTSFSNKWVRVLPGGHNEAPAMFKYNNKYFLLTSGCTGWEPNAARSFVAKSIWGPWEPLGNPCVGKDAEITFYSQSTYVLQLQDKDNAFIFMADRWVPQNPIDGRYVWLPLRFEGERPVIKWQNDWDLSLFD